jgi:hypothetical protein
MTSSNSSSTEQHSRAIFSYHEDDWTWIEGRFEKIARSANPIRSRVGVSHGRLRVEILPYGSEWIPAKCQPLRFCSLSARRIRHRGVIDELWQSVSVAIFEASHELIPRIARQRMAVRSMARVWNGMWRRVVPLLNADVLRFVRREHPHDQYQVYNYYLTHPHEYERVRSRPIIGRLRAERYTEAKIAALIEPVSEGFDLWTRTASFRARVMPRGDVVALVEHMRRVKPSVEDIRRIRTQRQWFLVNAAGQTSDALLRIVLQDPAEAERLLWAFYSPVDVKAFQSRTAHYHSAMRVFRSGLELAQTYAGNTAPSMQDVLDAVVAESVSQRLMKGRNRR